MNLMQAKAVENLEKQVEKGRKIVLAKAMIDAGYSENTAKAPSKVF